MAGVKLTTKTEKTGAFADDDLLHVVDVSDTTDDASGSSFKVELLNLFAGFTWIKNGTDYMVSKRNATPNNATIQDDDWVIYMTDTRLVIGRAKATISVLADLDDNTKFAKYVDGSPLL